MKIAIVGPCAAGKTSLAERLRSHGYRAKQVVQEHSFMPDMWRVVAKPDLLVYLDASYLTCQARKWLNWSEDEHAQQQHRLRHAREHCDIYIQTDGLGPEEVLQRALERIEQSG